ncbi:MAG: TonB-dependent receptor [Acidobacteria bacterium]|nr:TonB-dependent receptor [Acidobacteriota bacterium]
MLPRLAFLAALLCSMLPAQDARGRIAGRVMDPSGAAIPNAQVTATNNETSVRVSATANEAGMYDIPYLQPGMYTLTAAAGGFKGYERKQLQVRVGDQLAIDIPLEVGLVSESITVSGQASLLDTSTASVGRVVDSKRILDLPLPGGNALSLSRLAPGVVNLSAPNHPSLGPATEVLSSLTVNGVRSGNIEFTVDGTPAMWGTNAAYAPPTEMVAEFKVQTATYDASAGRAPGGNVNVVLRTGTNQFHGTLSYFHNDQHLQSLDLFQRQNLYNPATGPVTDAKINSINPLNILNRYGATFSGPVILPKLYNGRNKTFWIYSFEGLTRPGVERGNTFFTVPTSAQRGGNFSDLLKLGSVYQVYDPNTTVPAAGGRYSRQPFAGNIVPSSRLDKTALGLLPYWPDSNLAGTSDGRNNYTRQQTSYNEYRSHTGKVDHNFSERHRIFGRYNQWFQLFSSGQTFPNIANGNNRYRYNFGGVFDDVFVISPSLLNNVRIGFTRFEQTNSPMSMGFDLAAAGFSPALANAIDPQARVFPGLQVTAYQNLGANSPSSAVSNYYTFSDDVTWTKGKHTVKMGGEYRLYRENNYNFANMTPAEVFASAYTGGPLDNSPAAPIGQGLASFLLGIPTGGQINVNDSSAEQSKTTSFYIQDDWRLSSKLTINAGLRYDLDSPITERYNRSVESYDFSTTNPDAARATANYARNPLPELPVSQFKVIGGLTFAGVHGNPRTLWNSDKNNFAPRIGLAYSPFKDTVIRAGYGIFVVPLGADRASVNQSGYTLRTTLVPSIDNGQTYIASLANPFPSGWPNPPGSSLGLATDEGRAVSYFRPEGTNGYMQRYSFGIQQQIRGGLLFDASYVGNRGTRLSATKQYNGIPLNLLSKSLYRDQQTINYLSSQVANPFYPLPGSNIAGTNVARNQLLRPFPHFTGLSTTEPQGYSWYHSLQTTLEKRLQAGFTFQFNYTFSKMMEAMDFQNDADPVPAKVISDLDRRHRLALSGIYELPLGPGKKYLAHTNGFVRQVAGGWQLQAVWQMNTGQPIGFGNSILTNSLQNVPLSGSDQTLSRWFNTAAFNRNAAEQLQFNLVTMSSRFSGVRAPGVDVWDISGVKNFTLTEKLRMQFRAEFLNAMNHSNLTAPNTAPTNSLFGQITSISGFPRYIHFGLKLVY